MQIRMNPLPAVLCIRDHYEGGFQFSCDRVRSILPELLSTTDLTRISIVAVGFIGNVPVMLAKPQTLMNLSGQSVSVNEDLNKVTVCF